MGGLYFVFEAIAQGAFVSMVDPYIGMVVITLTVAFFSFQLNACFYGLVYSRC